MNIPYKIIPFIMSIFKRTTYQYINMDSKKEVISRLKFMSRINAGEKINVKHMFVQQDDLATRVSRTIYYKDNRRNTLTFVRDTIERSFEIIKTYKTSDKESDRIMCDNIKMDIKNARKGILNLKETYIDDIKFCCDIDTIIQDLDAKIVELDNESKLINNKQD